MSSPTWEIEPTEGQPLLVHVNATANGGGVAEILKSIVPAQREDGQNACWAVIHGTREFYATTKYLHHLLHDRAEPERLAATASLETYREVLATQVGWFTDRVGTGDVVVLHDPQTLGLAPAVARTGARVVWHCHIGTSTPKSIGPKAFWRAFAGDLEAVSTVVTTREEFAPPLTPGRHRVTVAPAVDPDSPKNRELPQATVDRLLAGIGLTGPPGGSSELARITQVAPLPVGCPVVLQVSRWDPLKDMQGLVKLVPGLPAGAHLVLVGTDPDHIPDDPEGAEVLADVHRVLSTLPATDRARVHLVNTSLHHPRESAFLVNAMQRRADVVVQKSLEEGFGLTVTEAMLKGRAVVATRVGGMRDQITDGVNGLLVDPNDADALRAAITGLLLDPARRRDLGEQARASARSRYTMPRLVADYRSFATPEPVTEGRVST